MVKRGMLTAIGFVAVGACLWWMAGGGRSQGSLPGTPARALAGGGSEPAPLLAEPAMMEREAVAEVRTAAGERTAVEPDPEPAATAGASTQNPSPQRTLIVRVLRSDTREPVPGERLALLEWEEEPTGAHGDPSQHVRRLPFIAYVDGSMGDLGKAPATDEDGRCSFRIPTGERTLLLPMRALGNKDWEQIIDPLAAGETRVVSLVMPVFMHWILVESASDGGPLAGARAREMDGNQEVSTGFDGLAALWCSEWRDEQIRIEADGYGVALVQLRRGHELPTDALVVALSRAACLRGRVLDAADDPIRGAQVSALANGLQLNLTEPINPWEGRLVFMVPEDQTWSAHTDAAGVFMLCGLPPSIPLQITASKGARLRLKLPEPIQLEPGEEREVVYRLGAGAVVRGVVRNGSGDLVPRCGLWLKVGAEHDDFGDLYPPAERKLQSDQEGRFEIDDVPDGEWCLGPAPDSGYLPIPAIVQVRGALADAEVLVEARPAFFVGGHVLGPDNEPVPGIQIHGGNRLDISARDGSFRIGPFAAGSVTLSVVASDLVALEPLEVHAGQEDIVLRLAAGGRISGRLVDAATVEPVEGMASVSGIRGMSFTPVGPSGEFMFQGLKPGMYGITARSASGGAGFIESVLIAEPGDARDDLVVKIAPGGRLALRFPPADQHVAYRLRSGACVLVHDTAAGEEVVTPYVPAGNVTVELLARGDTVLVTRETVVRAGETVLVDLSKDP